MRLADVLNNLTPALTEWDHGDSFTIQQRRVLVENGVSMPEELISPLSRLAFANAAGIPSRCDPLVAHRPALDPGKIEAARLSPTRRLELVGDAELVARTRSEKENGISLRSTTDTECAAALARLQPFLKSLN